MKAGSCHRFLSAVSLCALLSGCAHPVKISYPSEASIHPAFNQPFTTWAGERVRVVLTLESAEQLREDLQATQRLFDPKGTAIASHHVVVIAHSMGGLLAHTLVSDSGDALWNVFADKPFSRLTLSPSERNLISGYFFFRHQPSIERVIFLAVPHRGSRLASGIVGSIGSRLIRRPKTVAEAMKELADEDPGILDPYFTRVNARGGPTSLFSLAPNPLLDGLAALPIQVPFHSIIGDRGLGGGPRSSDGVVAYSSSHLAGAESEKIVPAGHGVFSNDSAVLEIKRILEENIKQPTGSRQNRMAEAHVNKGIE